MLAAFAFYRLVERRLADVRLPSPKLETSKLPSAFPATSKTADRAKDRPAQPGRPALPWNLPEPPREERFPLQQN